MKDKIIELARACGEIIKGCKGAPLGISEKQGHANFVTKYDKLVQDTLYRGLMEICPEAGFLGEEDNRGLKAPFEGHSQVFIVDPIDGTSNFLKGFNHSAISIALAQSDEPEKLNHELTFGLVYNPFTDELFTASRGEGAYLNGEQIHSSPDSLEMSLVLFGTAPYNEKLHETAFKNAKKMMKSCIDVRRLGSAALDLCYVACGRAGLYFEPEIQPWDFAGGKIIVEEAGGFVTRWDGSPMSLMEPGSCAAHGSGIDSKRLREVLEI